jgi:PPOX class probable F420-dependent enzyme
MADLLSARYMSLATFKRNGDAVATPVWFAEDAGKLYVFSAGDAGKVKRLRNGTRAQAAPCTVRGKLLGTFQEARGRIVDEPATIERAYRALRRKYGFQMWLTDLMSRLAGRHSKRAVLEIELTGTIPSPGTEPRERIAARSTG